MKRYWRLNLGAAVFLLAGLAFCRTAAVKAETNETEGKQVKIEELDPNMADKPVDENGMIWFTPDEKPFELLGFYWYDQDKVFRRLPVKPDVEISEGVDYLANHTAGGQIRFRSDCRKLVLKANLGISEFMPHMAPQPYVSDRPVIVYGTSITRAAAPPGRAVAIRTSSAGNSTGRSSITAFPATARGSRRWRSCWPRSPIRRC